MKMFLSIAAMIIAVSSCNKNDLNVPPEYEMLIGKWESYRFVFDNQYPGSHGNNYFVTEEFTGDSLPYKLILNLYADSWEVLSDKTFLSEFFIFSRSPSSFKISCLKSSR